jgi:hypothetical protein
MLCAEREVVTMPITKVAIGFSMVVAIVMAATTAKAAEPLGDGTSRRPQLGFSEFEAKLTASDAASDDLFGQLYGCKVIDGDTAIIGAPFDDNAGGTDAGSAYVFTRTDGVWTERQKLTASDASPGDQFGWVVVISGDIAFVGSPGDDHSASTDAGSVYVFVRSGETWVEHEKLIASDPAADATFGDPLSIDGDTLVVGALEADKVYVFNRSGDVWIQHQILTASDGEQGDWFGRSAILGDVLLVGACMGNTGSTETGAAYVFTRSGGVWTEQQKLNASDWGLGDCFGGGVAVLPDTLIVTAAFADHSNLTNPGAGYVFMRSGDTWTEVQKLTASEPGAGDLFGFWVAAEGETAVIGAAEADHPGVPNAGAAHIFHRTADDWFEHEELRAPDPGEGDYFGAGVALSGDTVMVSALFDDHSGLTDAGSVYVYRLPLFFDGFESGDTTAWSHSVPR